MDLSWKILKTYLMQNVSHIFLLAKFLSYMREKHNLYLSTMPAENQDIFSEPLYPAYIPETNNPIHQSVLQMLCLYLRRYPALQISDYLP